MLPNGSRHWRARTNESALPRRSQRARKLDPSAARQEEKLAARQTFGLVADALGVSQARISKIEHGEISGIDVVRGYIAALGGSLDLVATLGDRSWKVA